MEIITPKEQIRKFFFEKHFDFLTSVPQQRVQKIILSSCVKGNSGKMVDYAESGTAHRTTYGHFLAKGKWDDDQLEKTQKGESFQTILELSRSNKTSLFVSIDDTVLPKTVPSSKAKRPTQAVGWHYSHLEREVVYGYLGSCCHCWNRGYLSVQLSETLLLRKRVENRYDLKCDSISSR